MANELEIWALDGEADATRVKQVARTESELKLEATLVKNPEMLMPKLRLIGRQMRAGRGKLDLLGLDEKGQLVVFELKRELVARDAVTQIIDYASFLESLSDKELVEHIAAQPGEGIEQIGGDFDEWYGQQFKPEASLKPVQMTLVGLGADADATRIVEFLAKHDMPISMLTFRGYDHDGRVLLAKEVQAERDIAERAKARSGRDQQEKNRAYKQAIDERIGELKIRDFWEDVFGAFDSLGSPYVRKGGFNFYIPSTLNLPNHPGGFNNPLSILLTREPKIRIVFKPVSVHLCRQKFDNSKFGFEKEKTLAPTTNEIQQQWFLELGDVEWKKHREDLIALADAVAEAWREARRKSRVSS